MISVRVTIALLLGVIAVLLCGLGYVTWWQIRTAALQAQAETRRYESFALSEAMRQSSDQLTGMVRQYVVTGDPRYRQYYDEILAIRNGTAPRPRNYDGSFWDRVLAQGKAGVQYGPPVSLVEMMRAEHFSDAEFAALDSSRQASDELARIEVGVMDRVAQRIARGVDQNYAADVRPEYQRLADSAYDDYKARIMAAVQRFQQLVDQRTLGEVEALRARGQRLGAGLEGGQEGPDHRHGACGAHGTGGSGEEAAAAAVHAFVAHRLKTSGVFDLELLLTEGRSAKHCSRGAALSLSPAL